MASFMAGNPALRDAHTNIKTRMDKAVTDFQNSMSSTRTGRASVHMLDGVKVPYYGSEMPLNQVAQVHAPFDPSIIGEIEKVLRSGDLGFNPQNDGKLIRIPIPPLTQERRKEMVKHLHKVLEDHRTAVRNIRRDGNELVKKAKNDKKVSEDDEKRALEEIQKLTDDEIKKMEEMCKNKEKEVMQI